MNTKKSEVKVKRDIHLEITQRMIEIMESGQLPWRKDWRNLGGPCAFPTRANGEPYSGINVLALWVAADKRGFSSHQWMTFKQAAELGGRVIKGQHGEDVVFASVVEKETKGDDGTESKERIPFLKRYRVFNVAQIEGLPARFYATEEPKGEFERIEAAESFFAPIPATVHHTGNRAFYSRQSDEVTMPPKHAFESPEGYYSTLAHELAHWSGAPNRLNRTKGKAFGDSAYAFEELVAELTAAFTASRVGFIGETETRHAAYLQSWIRALKNDKRFIFKASSAASKAFEFLAQYSAKCEEVAA